MKEIADGVFHINCMPMPNAVNAFFADGVLFDAGARGSAKKILGALQGHDVQAHAITHAHADHQGASKRVCETLGVPYWAPELDADAAENPRLILERMPNHPMPKLMFKLFAGPGHRVDRVLKEGDDVGSFKVLFTPGHSPGHVAFWRESDRVLILGDVLNSQHALLGIPGLRTPPGFFTPDPETNRRSARRLGELEPRVICFGHGPVVRDTKKFVDFCAKL